MYRIYQILKILKEEFQCFQVDVSLAQCYEDENDEEGFDDMVIVLFSELCNDPIEIRINTNPEHLENFNVRKCCDQLRFELSCANNRTTDDFYTHDSKRIH
jgi:hypothetical protein